MKSSILIVFFLVISSTNIFSQSDTSLVVITLENGTYFTGHIEQEDSTSVTFRTTDGIRMVIPADQIVERRKKVSKATGKLYAFDDPNDTRLLFAPTSRTLKQGKGYIADYWVFFPFVAVGAFDQLVLAGGITLLPGAETQLFYLAPKVGLFQNETFGLATGLIYMNSFQFDWDGVGIAYGVSTIGNSDMAGTIGLGWGFSGGDMANKPIILMGGEVRVSQSIKLISENWIIPDSEFSLISLGFRFFGRRLATDFALIYPLGADTGDGFPFMPWLSFAYNF